MVRNIDIINFQSILSLINGGYFGIENRCSVFITEWRNLCWKLEIFLGRRFPRRVLGSESKSDYDSYVQTCRETASFYRDKLTELSDLCLNSNLNQELADKICGIYQEVLNRLVPLKKLHLIIGSAKIADSIDSIERLFNSMNLVFSNSDRDDSGTTKDQSLVNKKGGLIKADQLITESLTSLFINSLSYCDDYDTISQLFLSFSKRLDNALCPRGGLLPEDILELLSHLPQSLYQGFFYSHLQKKNFGDREYTELVTAVKKTNLDVFSRIIFDHNIYHELLKYYDLFKLVKSFMPRNTHFSYELTSCKNPINLIKEIRDYYTKNLSSSNSQTSDMSKMAAFNVILYHEVKKLCDENFIQLISNLINSDDVVRERFLLYERVNQWHSSLSSISGSTTPNAISMTTVKDHSSIKEDISTVDSHGIDEKLNCKFPDRIEDFIDYLVWRGYIKEGDQSSFKYYVFGGQKPSDYRAISFNFDSKLSASTMLGVIVWQLRKKNPILVELFKKTINKANCNIGTNNESMRIFVDLSLFFPSLWLRIRDTNKKEENRLIEKNLKKQVQKLKGNDDYINCSSILEFIKQLEAQNPHYWENR